MTRFFTRLSFFALLAMTMASPVLADDTPSGVASDVGAIQKDNAALAKDNAELAKHRAEKAADKANGNSGSQAVDSVKIGTDKTKRYEKDQEKGVDQRIMNSDVNGATTKSTSTPND